MYIFIPPFCPCHSCRFSFNKYSQIAARAVRSSLKEEQRVAAEKRGLTALRYQHWEDGKGGQQTLLHEETAKDPTKGAPV
ncbi:mitochondrial ATP synthase epsilon chain-domain-containing protein [Infundibulicybe gibba]|nr:mitochondrial ATP synthase epsilon chain-domain-containing protein [Infundibulicybe gibba]